MYKIRLHLVALDVINGDQGNDLFEGGSGNDVFLCGKGLDTIVDFIPGVDVRKAIIELLSIEYARWGPSRTVIDSIKKQVTYDQNKDKDIISFEIQLSQNATF
jgi:Ca2+-binding RTX toxin-like protein